MSVGMTCPHYLSNRLTARHATGSALGAVSGRAALRGTAFSFLLTYASSHADHVDCAGRHRVVTHGARGECLRPAGRAKGTGETSEPSAGIVRHS